MDPALLRPRTAARGRTDGRNAAEGFARRSAMRRCWSCLAVVVVVVAACACSSGGHDGGVPSAITSAKSAPTPTAADSSPSALAIHTDPSRTRRGRVPPGGSTWVSVRYPKAWYGDASETSLAVTSYPVHEPDEAIRAVPNDGAFILIIDYPAYSVATRRSPPRPRRIALGSLGNYDIFGRAYRIEFRDHHYGVLAFVVLGDGAASGRRATAITVLNSIRVTG